MTIAEKSRVLNEQNHYVAPPVLHGQNCVAYLSLLNRTCGSYDYQLSDLHKYTGVAQMIVLYCLLTPPNLIILMISSILLSHQNHPKWLAEHQGLLLLDQDGEQYSSNIRMVKSRQSSIHHQPTQSYQLIVIGNIHHLPDTPVYIVSISLSF
jgi:hypothetical protein